LLCQVFDPDQRVGALKVGRMHLKNQSVR
jgi:hypothetical protein